MLRWIIDQFRMSAPAPIVLDHLPIGGDTFVDADGNRCTTKPADPVGKGLSHRAKLQLAAERAGKPFRCAGNGLPRLVTKGGVDVAVGVTPAPAPEPQPPNVTAFGRKARA